MTTHKLTTKILSITVLTIVISIGVLGVYFDEFLKEIYFDDAKHRIIDAKEKLYFDVKDKELELIRGVNFIKEDKSLLASASLINNYQNKQHYNAILLDEEKKDILTQFIRRVKTSFNSDIALYDKNSELVLFIYKDTIGYKLNFISYENGKPVLYSKYDDEEHYKKSDFEDIFLYKYKHISYYTQPELKSTTPITFHYIGGSLYMRSHKSIFAQNGTNTLAHVEMSFKFDNIYFENLSKNLNMKIFMTMQNRYKNESLDLLEQQKPEDKNILQTNSDYYTILNLKTFEGRIYIVVSLDKSILNKALNKNRKEVIYFLIFITIVALALLYYLLYSSLSQPLSKLMGNIFKIENGDYSQSDIIESNDEIEEISKSVNDLSKAVNARESELKESQKKLEYLSTHDELTGLLNRRSFNVNFEYALHSAKRRGAKLALFFLDLDQFKQVNDTLGHIVGDELLQEVAKRLDKALRKSDVLARIGGDEFNIYISDFESIDEVEYFARKLVKEFASSFECGEYEINTTASIGIAIYPNDGMDSVTLIKNADLAMYKSKEIGRNNYSFFSVEFSNYLEERTNIVNALKVALKNTDEFMLLYQPKIAIDTKKIAGVEALIRWNSSVLGFVRPDQFISVAEDTHMIIEIGKWVLNKACEDFMLLMKEGYPLEQISINVSSIQLQYSDMLESVKEAIELHKIDASNIELEVTESYIATNELNAIEVLGDFREMGIELAIDDFGTGYSSMSYLQKLPVTRLKIDKAFIDDLPDSKESIAVVKAIIALAKTFNLQITAEGVETVEQNGFLRDVGCDEIQGYLYAKPLPLEELKEFILKNS